MSFAPPVEIAAWLACASFVAFLFNQSARAWFTLRGKPTPLDQAMATNNISERVSKIEQCIGSCKREQDRRLDSLESSHAALRELLDKKVGDVYERVKETAEDTNVLRGEVRGIKANTDLILQKLIVRR